MSKDHDHEELLEDLVESTKRKAPDGTPAVGVILVILILIGGGWFKSSSDKDSTNPDGIDKTGPFVAEECKITGCSNELCVGAGESISSTCEWKDQYACFTEENTSCEVQESGECGWTQTEEITECLAGA